MTASLHILPQKAQKHIGADLHPAHQFRIISWNLLRRIGAGVEDVASLVRQYHPDLLVMQEATEEISALPDLVGGHFHHTPLDRRIYGLAAWSPHALERPEILPLPVSTMPGRVPPRLAQIVKLGGATFVNVHLSHGQFLNRFQLLRIARALEGSCAIIGDYNAVGPVKLAGFRDIGPRQPTHSPHEAIAFRLDRCMARGLRCVNSRVLQRGPSDHHPILLELGPSTAQDLLHPPKRKSARIFSLPRNRQRDVQPLPA